MTKLSFLVLDKVKRLPRVQEVAEQGSELWMECDLEWPPWEDLMSMLKAENSSTEILRLWQDAGRQR